MSDVSRSKVGTEDLLAPARNAEGRQTVLEKVRQAKRRKQHHNEGGHAKRVGDDRVRRPNDDAFDFFGHFAAPQCCCPCCPFVLIYHILMQELFKNKSEQNVYLCANPLKLNELPYPVP